MTIDSITNLDVSSGFGLGDLFSGIFSPNNPTSKMTNSGYGTALATVGALNGLFNSWLGMKQYGLAKDQFKENKRQFELNYGAQKNLTNSRLEDRQRARLASNPNAYRSVGEYMTQYGVK